MNTVRKIVSTLALLTLLWHLPVSAQLATDTHASTLWLDALDLRKIQQQWGTPQAKLSVDKHPLTLKGTVYQHGIGTHAAGLLDIDLKGCAERFSAVVGVDDEAGKNGSVAFTIWVDGKKMAETGVLHGGDEPRQLSIPLTGAHKMSLRWTDGGDNIDFDHADWADARLDLTPGTTERPVAIDYVDSVPPPIIASCAPLAKPEIHGPRITGATPGRPFLFRIAATGEGQLTYQAKTLPHGLSLDPKTGIISGSLAKAGMTIVTLHVSGPKGTATRKLTIVGGEHMLSLTPPMGWNSWNVWGGAVNDARVRAAADAMVSSGLAAHGYQYINIDDTWEAGRDANGNIQTNTKFPDMKALADYVHQQGLKLGIYSSPGPKTCGGFEGSFKHEQQDATMYANWGIDYLKYDWCSCTDGDKKAPYQLMRTCLDQSGRDIVYSLCQYGMEKVWEWGTTVGGNCWRTTGDITDTWTSMSNIGFGQNGLDKFAGPGHWNDPDMLVVGMVGWGRPHPSRLTKHEQLTHITLWSLLSAPMLIGCDMTKLDDFTRDLLCNDEVIEVNQDPLGKPAHRIRKDGTGEIWARPLWDGTQAVGLFNRGEEPMKITVNWDDDLVLHADRVPVRCLWRRQQLGEFAGSFTATVQPHSAVLLKVGKPKDVDAYKPSKE